MQVVEGKSGMLPGGGRSGKAAMGDNKRVEDSIFLHFSVLKTCVPSGFFCIIGFSFDPQVSFIIAAPQDIEPLYSGPPGYISF